MHCERGGLRRELLQAVVRCNEAGIRHHGDAPLFGVHTRLGVLALGGPLTVHEDEGGFVPRVHLSLGHGFPAVNGGGLNKGG
jgi:hypothetical protein